MRLSLVLLFLLVSVTAFCQEALPTEPAVLAHLNDKIPSEAGWMAGLAIAIEFALRFVKSGKPLSILYGIANTFTLLGAIFGKLGKVSDKILPQRVKPVAAAEDEKAA